MKRLPLIIGAAIIIVAGLVFWLSCNNKNNEGEEVVKINNFQECVEAGNPVMESYPRQCRAGEQVFTEDIENEKANLIFLETPHSNQTIKSPLIIKGQARGYWFFEGDFPVVLTDWDGLIIGEGIATAQGEWMTEEFVPFTAVIEFETPEYKNNGSLILRKDNPSGLPKNDDALEIPILFEEREEGVLLLVL